MTDLLKAIQFLAKNKYIIQNRGRYLFTSKFYMDTIGEDLGIQVVDDPVVKEKRKSSKPKEEDWIYRYQQFIINAGIPQSSFTTSGESYRINTATKPGREAFKKAIEGGTTEEHIKQAVQIYYKESRQFRVKIEKFMVDEMWRSMDPSQNPNANAITFPRLA
jgi:hypothetical protein